MEVTPRSGRAAPRFANKANLDTQIQSPPAVIGDDAGINVHQAQRTAKLQRCLARATDILSKLREAIPPAVFLHAHAILIGRQGGGGFLFGANGGDAIAIRRLPGGRWSLPIALQLVDYSVGLVIGGFKSEFVCLILDEDFLSSLVTGKVVISDGLAGFYASPNGKIKFRHVGWGTLYVKKQGFMAAIAYRRYDVSTTGTPRLYNDKGILDEEIFAGRVLLEGDAENLSLYQLLRAIDQDGMDPEYQ